MTNEKDTLKKALLTALSKKDLPLMIKLIREGANVHEKNQGNYTALFMAADFGTVENIVELHKLGADLNVTNKSEHTPLFVASTRDRVEVIRALVGCGAYINAQDNVGATALHAAVLDGCPEAVSALLELGIDVNKKSFRQDKTALEGAVELLKKAKAKNLDPTVIRVRETIVVELLARCQKFFWDDFKDWDESLLARLKKMVAERQIEIRDEKDEQNIKTTLLSALQLTDEDDDLKRTIAKRYVFGRPGAEETEFPASLENAIKDSAYDPEEALALFEEHKFRIKPGSFTTYKGAVAFLPSGGPRKAWPNLRELPKQSGNSELVNQDSIPMGLCMDSAKP